MMRPPAYFDAVRSEAAEVWDLLEARQAVAGPWHRMFQQVQSPRHVLSELLQNADDVGATHAVVTLTESEFTFSHNGRDFTAEEFASLCRFGYSNKRALHTIGFRGVGFKSTFSLGPEVILETPSLAVSFHQKRFTEPRWSESTEARRNTTIRVAIADHHRHRELEKNLGEWLITPLSLLFFRHLRRLTVNGHVIGWKEGDRGPIPGSRWAKTAGSEQYLLLRSREESFPAESVDEIRAERLLSQSEELDLPPCSVEIVLGGAGKLFVVLPTGVSTDLPFAMNAPFVQDPARLKIKDPDISPTNRWLLKRIGELAADALEAWVSRADLDTRNRAAAYGLFANPGMQGTSLDASCAAEVTDAFHARIRTKAFVLTESGQVVHAGTCVAVPQELFQVWSGRRVATLFEGRQFLSQHVDPAHIAALASHRYVQPLDLSVLIAILSSKRVPKPETWRALLALWAVLAPEVTRFRYTRPHAALRIVPVHRSDELHAPKEVFRLGDKRLLESEADWDFISRHLRLLNTNWTRWLAEQRKAAEETSDGELATQVDTAYRVVESLGLSTTGDVDAMVKLVAERFFAADEIDHADAVRLAHIAASLGASVDDSFLFVTLDGFLRSPSYGVLDDSDGFLETIVAEEWYVAHVLAPEYHAVSASVRPDVWRRWIESARSRVAKFVPLDRTERQVWMRKLVREFLRERGFAGDIVFPYKRDHFLLEDFDFSGEHWDRWTALATTDPTFWMRLFRRFLAGGSGAWRDAMSARVHHYGNQDNKRLVTNERLQPAWLMKFRGLPCLPDTWNRPAIPSELLRRTPLTESMLDVEPFVHAELDTEENRPLLDALGVRSSLADASSLLDRLRALAGVGAVPLAEVGKWYRRLDVISTASTATLDQIRKAFAEERLILNAGGEWVDSELIFLGADEDDTGVDLVHPEFRTLTLWHRIGIPDRPGVEHEIAWIRAIACGTKLQGADLRRARSILVRHPHRVWTECGAWLNLENEWVQTGQLRFSLTMQSLVRWGHLFTEVKRATADFQKLAAEIVGQSPFSALPTLGSVLLETASPGSKVAAHVPEWSRTFGDLLARAVFADEQTTAEVRDLAQRLACTELTVVDVLTTTPFIHGTPAGTSRAAEAVWSGDRLYVAKASDAATARAATGELARAFTRDDVRDALKICYERPPDFVRRYLSESFDLSGPVPLPAAEMQTQQPTEQESGPQAAGGEMAPVQIKSDSAEPTGELTEPERNDAVPTPRHRAHRPPLMTRFALSLGFTAEGEDRFVHPSLGVLHRIGARGFAWALDSAGGELVELYCAREVHPEEKPMELDAEVWMRIESDPARVALVVTDGEGEPRVLRGAELLRMRAAGRLKIYPATYRVMMSGEGKE